MKKPISFFVFCLFLSAGFLHAGTGERAEVGENTLEWKAGVEKVNITPEQSMWMAGYGSRDQPSEGTLHDLWAKALAIEDKSGHRAVLITADLIRFSKDLSDRIRDRIEVKYGLSRDQILLNVSHTHTGPEVDAKRWMSFFMSRAQLDSEQQEKIIQYTEKLEDQIVRLVGEALQDMGPARLYAENGVTRFAVNRRNNPEDRLHELTEFAGPTDHAVPVIKVEDETGDLMAVAFGYACHATVLSFYQWSGDYPGFAQIELEKAYPGATALFFQGAGGDQNPLPRRSVPLAEQYGQQLAAAVQRVMNEEMRPLDSQLLTAYNEIDLKFANPPTKEELEQIAEESESERERTQAVRLLEEFEWDNSPMTSYPFPIQFWQLGDQLLLSLGGEPVVDYAIRFKRIFGQDTFVLGYSQYSPGYIPTARVIEEGGYEGGRSLIFTTSWHPNIETTILHEMIQLVNRAGVSDFNF